MNNRRTILPERFVNQPAERGDNAMNRRRNWSRYGRNGLGGWGRRRFDGRGMTGRSRTIRRVVVAVFALPGPVVVAVHRAVTGTGSHAGRRWRRGDVSRGGLMPGFSGSRRRRRIILPRLCRGGFGLRVLILPRLPRCRGGFGVEPLVIIIIVD